MKTPGRLTGWATLAVLLVAYESAGKVGQIQCAVDKGAAARRQSCPHAPIGSASWQAGLYQVASLFVVPRELGHG